MFLIFQSENFLNLFSGHFSIDDGKHLFDFGGDGQDARRETQARSQSFDGTSAYATSGKRARCSKTTQARCLCYCWDCRDFKDFLSSLSCMPHRRFGLEGELFADDLVETFNNLAHFIV